MKPKKTIYLFILPALLLYGLFSLYPMFYGLFISFTNWDGLTSSYDFVGMRNYKNLLTNDSVFAKTDRQQPEVHVVCRHVSDTAVADFRLVPGKNTRGNIALRTLFFFPTILSSVSVGFIWLSMYDTNFGLIKSVLDLFGLTSPGWLANPDIAIYCIAFVQVWAHTGQLMIIFIAGLQSIPQELYEVSALEGANRFQTFRNVTWPLIAPAAAIVIAYTTLQSFKSFDLVFAMTRGGPNYATEILSTFIYNVAFQGYKFGYASAASIIFMLFVATITIIQFKVLRTDRVNY